MTTTVKDTLFYYVTQYSLVDHNQSFDAMEAIAGIKESLSRGHSSPYISTIFPMLGLHLYPEEGVKKFLQNVGKYVRRCST
jgi:hypothetical protein